MCKYLDNEDAGLDNNPVSIASAPIQICIFAYSHIRTLIMGLFDFFKKKESTPQEQQALDTGLEKTKDNFFSKITKVVAGKSTVDDDVLDDLEEVLVTSDVGVSTTLKIIDRIQAACGPR